ncbi:SEC59/DGK1/VTE5 family protein [bacterium]|jgi:dolichol kinase|nr:SEC59/DGK1/VTE5 family protein [bacterium]
MKRFAAVLKANYPDQILSHLRSTRLAPRSNVHLARKIWHMSMGLMMAAIYMSGMSRGAAILTLGAALALVIGFEMIRLRIPSLNEKVTRVLGPIMRSSEINQVSGIAYYISAVILSIAIFPKTIAILSVLYLAVGDPVASFVGITYGSKTPRLADGKSLAGTAAGILACFLVGVIFLSSIGLSIPMTLLLAVIGGVSGGVAELLPLEIDDNFSIPIVSGFALWLTFIVAGI